MRKIILSLIILFLTATAAVGQVAHFLNFPTDARYAGMGGAGYALTSTAFAANYNPAAILLSGDRAAVGASFNRWQPKMANNNLFSLGGYYNINKKVGVMASVSYNSHAKINLGAGDSFRPSEYSINVGAAYSFYRNLSLGVALRYIGSDVNGPSKGSAFAADVALMYKYRAFNFALGASNLGSKMDYGNNKNVLPARVRLGVAYHLPICDKHNLTGALDAGYQVQPARYKGIVGGVGVEYNYNRLVSVRGGYNVGKDTKTGPSYATVGAGLQHWGLSLDFSYALASKSSPIKDTFLISLGWKL